MKKFETVDEAKRALRTDEAKTSSVVLSATKVIVRTPSGYWEFTPAEWRATK